MNRTLYYEDTYLRKADCTVTSVARKGDDILVTTDRTIFYPECGGQPGDRGKLGPFTVKDTRKGDDGSAILVLDTGRPEGEPQVGGTYTMELDWEHRFFFMVVHTAQHLLSGLLFSKHAIGTVAVHQGEEYLTIEVDKDQVADSDIAALIDEANAAIRENHRVFYREMSHADAEALGMRRSIKVDGDVRIVEIEGVDRIACGGIHVASTSEIQMVGYLGQEMIRGHVRLFFECGVKAVGRALADRALISGLTRHFSCSDTELEAKVLKLQAEKARLSSKLEKLSEKAAQAELSEHLSDGVAAFTTELDLEAVAKATNAVDDIAVLALNENGNSGRTEWLIVAKGKKDVPFNEIRTKVLSPFGAKGGGRPPMYRGVVEQGHEKEMVDAFLKMTKERV